MTPIEQAKELIAVQRWAEAAALLEPLTDRGDAEADYLYGSMLYDGDDSVPRAAAWAALRRAAALDHPAACFRVSITTVDEGGITTYPVVDVELLLRAARLGHADAQRKVGVEHATGDGPFPKNLAKARHWYERAAEQGEPSSQYDLGFMMLLGEGGPADVENGLRWLEASAVQDDPSSNSAARFLTEIYESGLYGQRPDAGLAARWRTRHAELERASEERWRASGSDRGSAWVIGIRPAHEDDWERMWRIFQAVVATGTTYVFAPETSEEDARAYWLAPGISTWVAEHTDAATGACDVAGMYKMVPNLRDLGSHVANASFMVDPAFHGKRIGESLGRHCLREAKHAGYLSMQFNFVVSTNTAAIALWRKLGFDIVGRLPKAFRHREDGLVDVYVMYRFLDDVVVDDEP
jgi:TPR repeat protein